jgi:hypothetical protein
MTETWFGLEDRKKICQKTEKMKREISLDHSGTARAQTPFRLEPKKYFSESDAAYFGVTVNLLMCDGRGALYSVRYMLQLNSVSS